MISSNIHKREKTESFAGSQLDFEFPNSSQSDVRTGGKTFSEVSSNGPSVNDTFKYLTAVSIASSNTLNTSELFEQLEHAGYHHDQKSTYRSQYSGSNFSVKIKDSLPSNNRQLSVRRSPTMKSINQYISRSPSVLQFKASPSTSTKRYVTQSHVKSLSKQSTLKRSNAIKHKEGWLTRLMNKVQKLKNSIKKWRMVVRRRAFQRRNNIRIKRAEISNPIRRTSSSLARSRSLMASGYKLNQLQSFKKPVDATVRTENINNYLENEQNLMGLQNLSQEILNEAPQTNKGENIMPQNQMSTNTAYPSSYPTPNVDINFNDQTETEVIYKMWSHFLKKSVMSRIQLKLDLQEYKDTRENKRESVLESIISDYEIDETDDDDEDRYTDGFESDTNNGHYSSLTSISSYDSEFEADLNSIQNSTEGIMYQDDAESDYQSSCYPTRNNSMINRELSIKRGNSIQVKRLLSTDSKYSEDNNLTYIEDLVTIKFRNDSNYTERYYNYSNPYISGRQNSISRSPSFVIPRRANTLMSVREE